MKANQKHLVSLFILFVLILTQFAYPQSAFAAAVHYVVPGGLTSGTCTSWATACDLQYAITTAAVAGDEIWVQQGEYKPTVGAGRSATFTLKDGVAIYGGFVGTETSR